MVMIRYRAKDIKDEVFTYVVGEPVKEGSEDICVGIGWVNKYFRAVIKRPDGSMYREEINEDNIIARTYESDNRGYLKSYDEEVLRQLGWNENRINGLKKKDAERAREGGQTQSSYGNSRSGSAF